MLPNRIRLSSLKVVFCLIMADKALKAATNAKTQCNARQQNMAGKLNSSVCLLLAARL